MVEKLDFDFAKAGHALCIIDSGADHADLTDEYAAIPGELKQLCRFFGREVLRDIVEEEFLSALPRIRHQVPDRAILRAVHFYQENKRVQRQAQALRNCDLKSLISVLNALIYLQNQYWERADLQNAGFGFAASLPGREKRGNSLGDADLERVYERFLQIYAEIPRTLCHDDLLPFNVLLFRGPCGTH